MGGAGQRMEWYSVTVEVLEGGEWRPAESPCTQVAEGADVLAEQYVSGYGLKESEQPWRVRVYSGYNRYDDLVLERAA
jgi:hypothetical protein